MHRIVIVEDHEATRDRLTEIVREHQALELTAACATLAEGRAVLASRRHFDVALIDLGLPDGSGIDLIREIRCRLSAPEDRHLRLR